MSSGQIKAPDNAKTPRSPACRPVVAEKIHEEKKRRLAFTTVKHQAKTICLHLYFVETPGVDDVHGRIARNNTTPIAWGVSPAAAKSTTVVKQKRRLQQ